MTRRKTTLITVETSEALVYRPPARRRAWCALCGAEVEMISPSLASRAAGISERRVFRLIEAGRLHFTETPEGLSLICLNTLTQIKELEDSENV